MADKTKTISMTFIFLIAFGLIIQSEASCEKSNEAAPVERAMGVPGLTSRWGAVLDWAKLSWINLRQPESRYGSTKSEKLKEAAAHSFEMGKETVEAAADAAARAAGDAADVAKKTLERTVSIHPQRKEESAAAEL